METEILLESHKVYPDPTKPVGIKMKHNYPSKSWILFIGFNILFPILFAVTYLWLKKQ